jgi:electron transport complex protein RnfA
MAGIRERIDDNADIPKCLRGLPIALVTAGLMSIAFMGFAGIIK